MESRDDQRRGGGNPAPATTYIILSRSGAGYLGSYYKPSIYDFISSLAQPCEPNNTSASAISLHRDDFLGLIIGLPLSQPTLSALKHG